MINQRKDKSSSTACAMSDCCFCPRECGADRTKGRSGWCRTGDGFSISSICAHRGEEPVISGEHGICNIFFNHCNMQCIYCQNYQISDNRIDETVDNMTLEEVISRVGIILGSGAKGVGFVSPSHSIVQMRRIMTALAERGYSPTYVYNTNGYDKAQVIKSLEREINVYLPDFKYIDNGLARGYSQAPGYAEIAQAAVKEMYRQKGADIAVDDDGLITSGLIIRHLVLPGHVENSKAVLRWIAEELSPDIHISLMSQYYPTPNVRHHPQLGRTLHPDEYEEVMDEFEELGFHRGFVQELSSQDCYRPDFLKDHPFE